MEKDLNAPVFGKHSMNELMAAQSVIQECLHFVSENIDSDDPEKNKAAHDGLMIISFDQMIVQAVMWPLVKKMIEEHESKKAENNDNKITISVPVP